MSEIAIESSSSDEGCKSQEVACKYDNKAFKTHDLAIQTCSTLLSILRTKEPFDTPSISDASNQAVVTRLTAVANLLVRDREVVAVTPKRFVAHVLYLQVIPEATNLFLQKDEFSSSGKPGLVRPTIHVTKNPEKNKDGAINFTTTGEIDTVGDIFTIANRMASFRQHTELTCSLVNAALNDSSDNGWSTLAKYHLMVSVDKLIRRCNEKYSRILHLITADDFAELPPHCIPIIPTSDVQLLRIIIHELNIKGQVPHTLNHLKQEPESIPSMQVFRDVHKVLVFLIDGVKTAAEVVQNILKNADIDRDALELAANKLFHLVVPIAGLSTTSTIKFVVEELIAKALPERSEQVNEQIEDERRVRQKEKEKKEQEARAAAEEKRKQRVANAQAIMQRQMAREPSTTLPASEAVQDSASPELEDIAAPSAAPEHTVLNDEDFTNDEEISDWDVDFHNLFDLKADTESRKVMTWLRLVGNTIHCARLFKKSKRGHSMPPLVFDILDYDRSPAYSLPWEAKIKELMPSYLYAEALKKLQEVDPRLKPGATLTFPGQVHCESMLASTLLMAKLRPKTEAKLESSVLARRVIHLPLFGVSKKCCPLCYRLLCEILDELKEPVTTFASHSTMFPWALPPGLPRRITQVLKDQCEKKLEYELHQLIRNSGRRPSGFLSQGPMESGSDQELIDFISVLFPMAVD